MDLKAVALVMFIIGVGFLWIAAGTRFIKQCLPEFSIIRLPGKK